MRGGKVRCGEARAVVVSLVCWTGVWFRRSVRAIGVTIKCSCVVASGVAAVACLLVLVLVGCVVYVAASVEDAEPYRGRGVSFDHQDSGGLPGHRMT